VRKTLQAYPMMPSLKRMIAYFHADPEWVHVRPPLVNLADEKWASLLAQLETIGFRVAPR
jgi:4-hydroxy-tetrahydrodipicolinate synthase